MKKLKNFFSGIRKETKKTRWPNKKEMIKYSTSTLILILFFGGFFYVLDVLFAFLKGLL